MYIINGNILSCSICITVMQLSSTITTSSLIGSNLIHRKNVLLNQQILKYAKFHTQFTEFEKFIPYQYQYLIQRCLITIVIKNFQAQQKWYTTLTFSFWSFGSLSVTGTANDKLRTETYFLKVWRFKKENKCKPDFSLFHKTAHIFRERWPISWNVQQRWNHELGWSLIMRVSVLQWKPSLKVQTTFTASRYACELFSSYYTATPSTNYCCRTKNSIVR